MNKITIYSMLICLFTLGGCALMSASKAPDIQPLQNVQITLPQDIQLAADGWPKAAWWLQYHDDTLNKLI